MVCPSGEMDAQLGLQVLVFITGQGFGEHTRVEVVFGKNKFFSLFVFGGRAVGRVHRPRPTALTASCRRGGGIFLVGILRAFYFKADRMLIVYKTDAVDGQVLCIERALS